MYISDLSIRRPVLTIVMSAMLVLFGLISWTRLGVDMFPNVDTPYVSVSTIYPGADPEVVESRIIEPIEDAVSTLAGVKRVVSAGVESYGMVMVEFELGINADVASQDVRERIATIQKDLPSDAELPLVEKFQLGAAPVITLALTAPDGQTPAQVTEMAEKKVKRQIQRIAGVGTVDVIGKQGREVHILADPAKLRSYYLTMPDVQQAVGYGNLDVPAGHVISGSSELLVKTHGEAKSIAELENIVIAAPGGAPIRLKDVAQVVDSQEEARTKASWDGKPALSLLVRKQTDANRVAVAEQVKKAIEEGKIVVDKGYELHVVQDGSTFIRQSIKDVLFDLVFGAVLAVLVIMIFLRDLRATFISALALPTSVIATFAFMYAMGFTSNVLTMLALSLSIGMLIDDAIVVIENIHRHLGMGKTPMQAAGDGVREIGPAVFAVTLSIVAVFVPVALMKGIVGQFFFEFGLTVSFAIMVSLFVSFTLTPMASSRMLGAVKPNAITRAIGKALNWLDRLYRELVVRVLRHRILTVSTGVVAFLAALWLAQSIPTEFIPAMDQGEIEVSYAMPESTNLDATFLRGEQIQQVVLKHMPDARHLMLTVGAGRNQKVNEGALLIRVAPKNQRQRSVDDNIVVLREAINAAWPDLETSLVKPDITNVTGDTTFIKEINVQLRGLDRKLLSETAHRFVKAMQDEGHFVDIAVSDRGMRGQFGFSLRRDKVSGAGLVPAQVAGAIRTAITGSEVSQYRDGSDRYPVIVKGPDRYREQRDAVLSMPLRGGKNNLVDVGELVQPFSEQAPSQIDREDRSRTVTILANLQGGMAQGEAQQLLTKMSKDLVPAGVTMKFGGQGEMMIESFAYMLEALILAIAIIYLVLAAQFESFIHPLTIMMSLPLSLIGAIGGLMIVGHSMSIVSLIGIIMLMGLVTKNAILLVDNANQRRAKGASVSEAIVEAGATRLRPILMTTAAMIFGMLPIALALGEGAEVKAPMGVCVIGGLVTSTMLTLLVVPAVYSWFEGGRQWVRDRRADTKDKQHA